MKGVPADLDALCAGGKAALARTLSAVESHAGDAGLASLLDAAFAAQKGVVIGLTGPPGVGKSSLVNVLVARLRAGGRSVGIIAVDPSSRRSRGALLGDRTRIESDPEDAGTFVRSMAARERLGGLADLTFPAAVLMRAVFDMVIVETVGVGQSETDVTDVADIVVFCVQPGSGDALQFMKAGVTEVPDLVLVTKGDTGAAAARAAADVKGALSLGAAEAAAVMIGASQTGDGIAAALGAVEARLHGLAAAGTLDRRRAEQGRIWCEGRLRESFGSEGIRWIAGPPGEAMTPFASHARRRDRALSALRRGAESG
ncbi:ATP/GTP-binding protein [soil metagenome]